MKVTRNLKKVGLLAVPFVISTSIFTTEIILADSTIDQNTYYYKKPTAHPVKFLGRWRKGGFDLEPDAVYTAAPGEMVSITTHSVRPFLSVLEHLYEPLSHTWYMTKNDKDWSVVKKADDDTYVFKAGNPGISRYQLHDLYKGIFTSESYYSDIATVKVLPKAVMTQSLSISVDNDYIYNSENTFDNMKAFASSKKYPHDATGQVQWSVSDPSKATIDSFGRITAKQGAEGSFYIQGIIKNKDGTEAGDTKLMNVGGGLYDQSVRAKKMATFHIQGFDNVDKDEPTDKLEVIWTRTKDGHSESLTTPKNDPFTYTTKPTTEQDNGYSYQATIKSKGKTILTTSKGLLTVLPALDPNVELTDSIQNTSLRDKDDTDHLVNNVVNGDSIEYYLTLNNNGQKDLHDTKLSTYFNANTTINKILLDNQELILNKDFTIEQNKMHTYQVVSINIGNLNIKDKKNVTITSQTHDIKSRRSFYSLPSFTGLDPDQNRYQSIGSKLQLNYVSNNIDFHFNNIQFEPIEGFESDVLKHRTADTNDPNNIITIDDQRRKKNAIRIFLKHPKSLLNTENSIELPADLLFYKLGADPQTIENKVLVANSLKNQTLQSVKWNRDEGLLLHVENAAVPAGDYSTKLTWCIEESV